MEELNQLEKKYDLVKELVRKEFPIQFRQFLKGKMGRDYLNLFDLIESYFSVINDALDLEKVVDTLSKKCSNLERENVELRKTKQEGDLYELVEKIRGVGGKATISITLPERDGKRETY
ncbi:MAG: hypothetical protein QXU40_01390 [Candidatus Pacearchaeota archaeon]